MILHDAFTRFASCYHAAVDAADGVEVRRAPSFFFFPLAVSSRSPQPCFPPPSRLTAPPLPRGPQPADLALLHAEFTRLIIDVLVGAPAKHKIVADALVAGVLDSALRASTPAAARRDLSALLLTIASTHRKNATTLAKLIDSDDIPVASGAGNVHTSGMPKTMANVFATLATGADFHAQVACAKTLHHCVDAGGLALDVVAKGFGEASQNFAQLATEFAGADLARESADFDEGARALVMNVNAALGTRALVKTATAKKIVTNLGDAIDDARVHFNGVHGMSFESGGENKRVVDLTWGDVVRCVRVDGGVVLCIGVRKPPAGVPADVVDVEDDAWMSFEFTKTTFPVVRDRMKWLSRSHGELFAGVVGSGGGGGRRQSGGGSAAFGSVQLGSDAAARVGVGVGVGGSARLPKIAHKPWPPARAHLEPEIIIWHDGGATISRCNNLRIFGKTNLGRLRVERSVAEDQRHPHVLRDSIKIARGGTIPNFDHQLRLLC